MEPALARLVGITAGKSRRISDTAIYRREASGELSLSGGASIASTGSSCLHHLPFAFRDFVPKRRGRPVWVALAKSPYDACALAHTPLGEGTDVDGGSRCSAGDRARRRPRGPCRLGDEHLGSRGHRSAFRRVRAATIAHASDERKRSTETCRWIEYGNCGKSETESRPAIAARGTRWFRPTGSRPRHRSRAGAAHAVPHRDDLPRAVVLGGRDARATASSWVVTSVYLEIPTASFSSPNSTNLYAPLRFPTGGERRRGTLSGREDRGRPAGRCGRRLP